MTPDDKNLSKDSSASKPKNSQSIPRHQESPGSEHQRTVSQGCISGRSTSTAAQRARVLDLLKAAPQTTYSLRAKGISHGAARVMELRQAGFPISSTPVNA